MRLGWNEIAANAARFAADWADARYEKGETQSFYNDFFAVFGVKRRQVATFEEPVKKLGDKQGFIDLFWRGVLLVEQKSAGRSLTPAKQQALDYFPGLKPEELPRYILLSNFQTFELHNLEAEEEADRVLAFPLAALPDHVQKFGFILGVERRAFRDQDPVNIAVAEKMGELHDALEASGYRGHDLERFLVRLLFCLFADNTGIFEPRDIFLDLLERRSLPDGRDLGALIAQLFQTLDTPADERPATLDPDLAQFPYINGSLFEGALRIPSLDAVMRTLLIEACTFDWGKVSPAIFGSLFQSVMDRTERRKKGAHYTTEANILKVIGPLFLDELTAELERVAARRTGRAAALTAFQDKLASLKVLDPACGCGNFLIIAYRELRTLEMRVLHALNDGGQLELDVELLSRVEVDQFYGIELEEFPARIAEVAMWMMDHIMNVQLSLAFGRAYARIPLRQAATIWGEVDALEVDWNDLLPAAECFAVLGNPPFVGHQWRNPAQRKGMQLVWGKGGQFNRLDYVTCWFKKAVDYAGDTKHLKVGFVATNSICQGEQAGILWPYLFSKGVSIFFAHRTFAWNSEARGQAAVHCVIIGMAFDKPAEATIFDYKTVTSDPTVARVRQINAYLVEGALVTIPARTTPPPGLPAMFKGSQPTDGARLKKPGGGYILRSNLILEKEDRDELIRSCPEAEAWLRPYVGGDELVSGEWRWCLWLKDVSPTALRSCKPVMERLARVRAGRLQSPTESVQRFADSPALFTQDRQPEQPYIGVPEVSSENRKYIPIALLQPEVIASNKLQIIPLGTLFHFGLLTSAMHMAWVSTVVGRLESRFSYSPTVYNTFPWPDATPVERERVEGLAQGVLDARATWPDATLADLYDPDAMPADLRRAHRALDAAVDRLYRREPFTGDRDRVEHLFGRYEALIEPLEHEGAKQNKRVSRKAKRRAAR